MQEEYEMLVSDIQKEYSKSNRRKDYAIIVLIILMFLEAVAFYFGFVYYESNFDYVIEQQEGTDIETSGDNANAEYINGNQYNSSVHNQGGE